MKYIGTSIITGKVQLSLILVLVTVFGTVMLSYMPQASADPLNVVEFTSSGGVTLGSNAYFDVKESGNDIDCAEKGSGPISVTIKSIKPDTTVRDTITLQAIEIDNPLPGLRHPTPNTCIFGNTFLFFSPDNQRFAIESTVTITQHDTNGGKAANGKVDTVVATVSSTSTPGGTSLTLTETGPNTGIFQGKIKFTAGVTVPNSALHVSKGDIIVASYLGIVSYGQILPSPNGSTGFLVADVGDTIKATYNGFSGTTTICICGGSGGGGGGLIRPGLVLDVVRGLSGGGGLRILPPQFSFNALILNALPLPENIKDELRDINPFKTIKPIDYSSDDMPLTIDNKSYPLISYANTISTSTLHTGKPSHIRLVFKDYYEVTHVGLYTNVNDISNTIYDSDTYVIYNKGDPLKIADPHHYFSYLNLTRTVNDTKYIFDYNVTFAEPMDKSGMIIRAWNDRHSSFDWKILDAIEVVKPSPQRQISKNEMSGILQTQDTTPEQTTVIKINTTQPKIQDSIKTQGLGDFVPVIRMWSGDSAQKISDSDLLHLLGTTGNHIPSWFTNVGHWTTDGQVTQKEFIDAISYMNKVGAIQ